MKIFSVNWLGLFLACCVFNSFAKDHFYLDELCRSNHHFLTSITLKVGSPSTGHNSSGILKASKHRSYKSSWSCTLHLEPPSNHGIVIALREVSFRTGCVDSLTLIDSFGDTKAIFCQSIKNDQEWSNFVSLGRTTLSFRTGRGHTFSDGGFELTFTVYREDDCFSNTDFQCDNRRCISKLLRCDGDNHCGDRSDQKSCRNHSMSAIIGGVLGGIFFVTAFIAGVICCSKRKKSLIRRICRPPQTHHHEMEQHHHGIAYPHHQLHFHQEMAHPQNHHQREMAYPTPCDPYSHPQQPKETGYPLPPPYTITDNFPMQNSAYEIPQIQQPHNTQQNSYPSAPPILAQPQQNPNTENHVLNEKDNLVPEYK